MLTIEGLIAALALCGTCFSIGYTIGFHHGKTQKQPPRPGKLSGYYLFDNTGPAVIMGCSILFSFIVYMVSRKISISFVIVILKDIPYNYYFFQIVLDFCDT